MADCTDIKASRGAKLYASATALTTGQTPTDITWTEVSEVMSTDRSDEVAMIELNARAYTMLANCPGRRGVSVNATLDWSPGGTGFDILEAAYIAKTKIALADMDSAITVVGAKGVVGNFYIANYNVTAGNDDGKMEVAVTFQPTDPDLFFDYEVAAASS